MLFHLAALTLTVALGVASRLHATGLSLIDKSAGDVLYAVAAFLTLRLVLARRSLRAVALIALATCWAIEIFQATGIPARHADLAVVRWVIGTTFSWHDMGCYAVGVALGASASAGSGRGLRAANPIVEADAPEARLAQRDE